MEHIPVLRDLVVLVAVAIPAVLLAHRLNIPTLVGFLFTGIVIGPHALGFVRDTESVTQMAEIGSVLLLFAVGLELSLSRIVKMGRYVIQGGMIQMLGTIGIVASVAVIAGLPVNSAVLWGALIAEIAVILCARYTDMAWLWWNVVGCGVGVGAAMLIQLLMPKSQSPLPARQGEG